MSEQDWDFIIDIQKANIAQGDEIVLHQVEFTIQRGEFVYLIGKTGSGKSSLLKSLYADLPLASGKVFVDKFPIHELPNREIPYLRRTVGVIFQDFELFTDRTVEENMLFVMKATGWKSKTAMTDRIRELLELVSLDHGLKKYPFQLSGGEQQRAAIARALINDPKIILADEPTGNLDPVVANTILGLFKKICDRGTAVLMATHQHNLLKQYAARVLYCEDGNVRDIPKAEVVNRILKRD
jgi:cell division transport system ATP-binding protein